MFAALVSLILLSLPSTRLIFIFPLFPTIGASVEFDIVKLSRFKFTSPSAFTTICPSSSFPLNRYVPALLIVMTFPSLLAPSPFIETVLLSILILVSFP